MARKQNRPRPTLFDYALIAINPVLVMLMVGSLMFFLVVVLYRGEFETRICFILAMFVMGIVLITRISVEEGTQYASRFAIPLAIVVFLALGRFVSFPGPLAFFSVWINCGLIALVWWSSHRITWDCTVINESVESPGEGLLQSAGLEMGEANSADRHDVLDGTSVTDQQVRQAVPEKQEEPPLAKIWRAYREAARKPHSHGMWVIYFAIAALPIFGIGQGLIDTLGGRRYAFFLFCIYLLSSLGLLMTTSLLGLRRYMRQRHLEMPANIPVAWFGTGGFLILVVLLACLILPRPYPEYSVSHSNWFATSPVTLETNFWGTFEGKESPGGAASSDSAGEQEPQSPGARGEPSAPSDSSAQGNEQPSGESQGANREPASGDSGSQGDRAQGASGGEPSGESDRSSPQGESRGESPGDSGDSGDSSDGSEPRSGEAQSESPGSQGTNGESSDSARESEGEPSRPGDRSTNDRQSDVAQSSPEGSDSDGQSTDASGQPSGERSGATAGSRTDSTSRSMASSSAASSSATSAAENEAQGSSAISSPRSASSFPSFSPSLAGILTFLYYVIVILGLVFLLWKFREPLRDGLRRFWQDLQNWLAGRRGEPGQESEASVVPEVTPPMPRFAEFPNPFRGSQKDSRSPAELVRYSFLALEAWAREFQVARRSDETPLEFARRLGREHPSLSRASRDVCLLYSQLAYGGGRLPAEAPNHLRHFWTTIEADSATQVE